MLKEGNVVVEWMFSGLYRWERSGAQVTFLTYDGIRVPKIWAPVYSDDNSLTTGNPTVIIIGGQHLDEVHSTGLLLRQPQVFNCLRRRFNLLIYPVINQSGLSFPHDSGIRLLREDDYSHNYNSFWGFRFFKKATEVFLVEDDIIKNIKQGTNVVAAISFHSDSELPYQGYVFIDKWDEWSIQQYRQTVETHTTIRPFLRTASNQPYTGNGQLRDGWIIVNYQDIDQPGSFENWMNTLRTPTLVIEAPHGVSPEIEMEFSQVMIEALAQILPKITSEYNTNASP